MTLEERITSWFAGIDKTKLEEYVSAQGIISCPRCIHMDRRGTMVRKTLDLPQFTVTMSQCGICGHKEVEEEEERKPRNYFTGHYERYGRGPYGDSK